MRVRGPASSATRRSSDLEVLADGGIEGVGRVDPGDLDRAAAAARSSSAGSTRPTPDRKTIRLNTIAQIIPYAVLSLHEKNRHPQQQPLTPIQLTLFRI